MSLETDICEAQGRIALHDWIDELPLGAMGVVVVCYDDPNDSRMHQIKFHEVGNTTLADTLYLLKTYEYRLLSQSMKADDD